MATWDDLRFAEGDGLVIAAKLKAAYEAVRRETEPGYFLAEGDPVRLIFWAVAALLAQVNTDIDFTGKSNLLYFSKDEWIENLGYLYGPRGARLSPAKAVTTMRYTLSTARTVRTIIPQGFRTTPDNKVFFATVQSLEIAAGDLFGDVTAECQTAGDPGMGWAPGDIKNMVDINPFVSTAVNLTETSGGADEETLEAYRARLRQVPESFSVAGPDGAYEFWALTANPAIIDARAWMPDLDLDDFATFLEPYGIEDAGAFYEALGNYYRTSGTGPGNVNVGLLLQGGILPSQEVIDQVYAVLNDKYIRPLTDFLHVKPATAVNYNISASYWILNDDSTQVDSINQAVTAAVSNYLAWQSSKIGRDINPSRLIEVIMGAGAKRVEVYSPVFTVLKPWEIGILGSNSVIYQGLEEL